MKSDGDANHEYHANTDERPSQDTRLSGASLCMDSTFIRLADAVIFSVLGIMALLFIGYRNKCIPGFTHVTPKKKQKDRGQSLVEEGLLSL